jgi:ADP-heptose:LPS heptosyltransferase
VDLSGRSSLPELAALVASTRLLICGDTGVAHLATATSARSVLLFGPTSPRLWGPAVQPGRHVVLWAGQDARPGDPHGSDPDPALLALQPAGVLAAARAQLALPDS